MRMHPPILLEIPSSLVEQAQLYAPTRHPLDAVCWVLERHSHLVADLRDARRRLAGQEREGAELDALVERLRLIAQQIADL